LKLTDVEAQVLVFNDDGSTERMEHLALCVYGCLLMKKSFNYRAMKSIFRNIWKSDKGVFSL